MAKKNTNKSKNQQLNTTKFTFTKKDLITNIAKKGQITIQKTEIFYDLLASALQEAITNYPEVNLPSIGKFVLTTLPARTLPQSRFNYDPKTKKSTITVTNKKINYPAITMVRFKVAENLKKAVKLIKLT